MEDRVRYDLQIYRGTDYRKTMTFNLDGDPIDLTNYTIAAQIRKSENAESLVAAFTFDTEPTAGRTTMGLDAETTAEIDPGVYFWDLKLIDGTGVTDVWIYGKVVILGRVTV